MDAERNRKYEFMIYSEVFRKNAFLLIDKIIKMAESSHFHNALLNEILHSIFFLGGINCLRFSPEKIVADDDMFNELKKIFPNPFELYSSHLPRRSPFSCVLDMVVLKKGQENEKEIITTLAELVRELMENPSNEASYATICVSDEKNEKNTDTLVYLKEYNDDDITTLLKKLKKLMEKASDTKLEYTKISVSFDSKLSSEGHESVDEIITKLQELIRRSKNATNDLYPTICVSRGNSTISVVILGGQEREDRITTKLEEDVKKLMENCSKKADSTIYVSRGNCTISVASLKKQEDQSGIKQTSKRLVRELMGNIPNTILYSATICVSQTNKDSKRHYGVSMSTFGDPARKILIGASCLNYWEEHVADAVMSYYPKTTMKTYFNGTIKIPDDVRCQAFDLKGSGQEKNPCLSCGNMFGLINYSTKPNPYGNCAEAESLSKLLREENVTERVQRNENWTEEGKKKAVEEVTANLKSALDNTLFKGDIQYYHAPQGH